MIRIFIFFTILVSSFLIAKDKIPRAKIEEYNFIKKEDVTKKWQINFSYGHHFSYWDNQMNNPFYKDEDDNYHSINWIPNTDNLSIQFGFDRYFLFYNALTFRLSYTPAYKQLYLAGGYKLNLYSIFYLKAEVIAQFFSNRYEKGYEYDRCDTVKECKNNEGEEIKIDIIERYKNSYSWDLGTSISLGTEFNIIDNFQIFFYPLVLDILLLNSRNLTTFHWESYIGIGYYVDFDKVLHKIF